MTTNQPSQLVDISYVIPTFNEEQSIAILANSIATETNKLSKSFEIIFINDGSTDQSWSEIKKLKSASDNITGIRLQRNSGKASALQAGFDICRGKIVFMMDADLQDDPINIPKFIEAIESGYDLVTGWRKSRKDTLFKRIASGIFNSLVSMTTKVHLQDHNCGFKAIRRKAIKSIYLYGELHRFITALISANGFKIGEIEITHNPRKFGKSKYGVWRYISSLFDLTTVMFLNSFRHRPLHFLGIAGALFILIGAGGLSYLAFIWFANFTSGIGGRPLLIYSTVALLLGVQLVVAGIIAELITANKLSHHRTFLVAETTDSDDEDY